MKRRKTITLRLEGIDRDGEKFKFTFDCTFASTRPNKTARVVALRIAEEGRKRLGYHLTECKEWSWGPVLRGRMMTNLKDQDNGNVQGQ